MSGAHLGLLALGELSETDPRRAKSAAQLGRLLADGGDADSALEVLSPLLESPNVDLALEVGDAICDILENKGAGERWLRVIQRMQERLLESGARGKRAYHRARALHLNSHARADEAIAQCELALVGAEPGEETQRASQRMAFACILGGRIEDAQIAARRAMQHSGGRADLRARSLRTLAMIPLRRGHSAQARAFLGEAIEIVRCQAMAARLPVLIADVGNSYLAEQRYEEARARFIESHRAATELDNRWSIIFAEFRLLLCDLLEGKTKNVRERFAELSPRAADAGVMILALAKGPMLAWCDVLEGRHDAALQTIRAYGELRHFPRIPDAGYCTEGIGRQLAIAARLDRPDLRDEAIVMLATASSYWQAMGNLDRQAGVDALREELRAEAADPDAAVPSSVLTGKEGGGRVPGS